MLATNEIVRLALSNTQATIDYLECHFIDRALVIFFVASWWVMAVYCGYKYLKRRKDDKLPRN